ncbi:hypothetical protein [Spiroplasma sp. DGKH1]|uniref:hypothetical protein n=1 Tax=Spiroplasma sp. DGKH1 TaxID=3050074 RepID=UPI0034C6CD5F
MHNIVLESKYGNKSQSSSNILDIITNSSNVDNKYFKNEYLDKLPKKENYNELCKLFTISNLLYQVENGGFSQYICNGYNEGKNPKTSGDVELFNFSETLKILRNDVLIDFLDKTTNFNELAQADIVKIVKILEQIEQDCDMQNLDINDSNFSYYQENWEYDSWLADEPDKDDYDNEEDYEYDHENWSLSEPEEEIQLDYSEEISNRYDKEFYNYSNGLHYLLESWSEYLVKSNNIALENEKIVR